MAETPNALCAHCMSHVGTVYCSECTQVQCSECDQEFHTNKANHQRTQITHTDNNDKDEHNEITPVDSAPLPPTSSPAASSSVSSPTVTASAPTLTPTPLTIPLCAVCASHIGERYCRQCKQVQCRECDKETHRKREDDQTHQREPYPIEGEPKAEEAMESATAESAVAATTNVDFAAVGVPISTPASSSISPIPTSVSTSPVLCSHCLSHIGTIHCTECEQVQCQECEEEIHTQRGDKANHKREPYQGEEKKETGSIEADRESASTPIEPPNTAAVAASESAPALCAHCLSHIGTVYCSECTQVQCSECDQEFHTNKANHQRTQITHTDNNEKEPTEITPSDSAPLPPTSSPAVSSPTVSSSAPTAIPTPLTIPLCAVCASHIGERYCRQCKQVQCRECDKETHRKREDDQTHQREPYPIEGEQPKADETVQAVEPTAIETDHESPIEPTAAAASDYDSAPALCAHCLSHVGRVYCAECIQVQCTECDQEFHGPNGDKANHQRVPYPAETPAAVEADPIDSTPPAVVSSNAIVPSDSSTAADASPSSAPSSTPVGVTLPIDSPMSVDEPVVDDDTRPTSDDSIILPTLVPTSNEGDSGQEDGAVVAPAVVVVEPSNQPEPHTNQESTPPVVDSQSSSSPSTESAATVNVKNPSSSSSSSPSDPAAPAASVVVVASSPSPSPSPSPSASPSSAPSTASSTGRRIPSSSPTKRSTTFNGNQKVRSSTTSASSNGSTANVPPPRPATSAGMPESTFSSRPLPERGTKKGKQSSQQPQAPNSDRTHATPSPSTGGADILLLDIHTPSSGGGGTGNGSTGFQSLGLSLPGTPGGSVGNNTTSSSMSHDKDNNKSSITPYPSTGNVDKDKMNYNYVLYSLRNKVTKLEEQLDEVHLRAMKAEDQSKIHYEGFVREQMKRKEVEAALSRERTEHVSTQGQIHDLHTELEQLRSKVATLEQTSKEQTETYRLAQIKSQDHITQLEKQVSFHTASSNEKSLELQHVRSEVVSLKTVLSETSGSLKKEKELNGTYRVYSQQYESLILTLREKLGEAERKHISMNKWKLKAHQYAEEWELERKKMKRKILKTSEILETVRKDLKDYKALLKFVAVKGYVNQYLLRRQLRRLFQQSCDMATTNLIEQTEGTPGIHNSVQFDEKEDLSVRNSKLLSEYPWGTRISTNTSITHGGGGVGGKGSNTSSNNRTNLRFPPMGILIQSISQQLHVCSEASALIRQQKRKWQQTADGFFQRNVELTNSYLHSDLELLTHKKKSSALRSHTRLLQTKHMELETQLSSTISEKNRLASEIENIERQARSEKSAVNIIHMKKFERSVELTRRCLALETELKSLEQQRERLMTEVSEVSQERRALATLTSKESITSAAAIADAQLQQHQLLIWSKRCDAGISSPTRGMVTSKPQRPHETSPQRHPSQGVHYVHTTPIPPKDAYDEHKTQQQQHQQQQMMSGGSRTSRRSAVPDFNYATVSRPVTAAFTPNASYGSTPNTTVDGASTGTTATFTYPSSSAGVPVIARSVGRPMTSGNTLPIMTTMQQQTNEQTPTTNGGFYPMLMPSPPPPQQAPSSSPFGVVPSPPISSGSSRRSRSGSGTFPTPTNDTFDDVNRPSTKSSASASIRPILAAYSTSPLTLPPTRSRPSSSVKLNSRDARREARRQAQVDSLNRSILDVAMQRAARRVQTPQPHGSKTAPNKMQQQQQQQPQSQTTQTNNNKQTPNTQPHPPAQSQSQSPSQVDSDVSQPASVHVSSDGVDGESDAVTPAVVASSPPQPPPVQSLKDAIQAKQNE